MVKSLRGIGAAKARVSKPYPIKISVITTMTEIFSLVRPLLPPAATPVQTLPLAARLVQDIAR